MVAFGKERSAVGQAKAVTDPVVTDARELVQEVTGQMRSTEPINLGRILQRAVTVSDGIQHVHNRLLLIRTATGSVEGIRTIDKRCRDAGFTVMEFEFGPDVA
jgi:hypothetical protein